MTEKEEPTQRELAREANEKLRDAAKWLIGAFAAVGAALIAGSQLSNIGKLTICAELTLECTRLWWAIGGAIMALVGVTAAIWVAVGLLTAESLTVNDIRKDWRRGKRSAVRRFFERDRTYLAGFKDFDDIARQEAAAEAAYDKLSEEFDRALERDRPSIAARMKGAADDLDKLYAHSQDVLIVANQVAYGQLFRTTALRRILLAATAAAIGIGLFAWAANPPDDAAPAAAALRGADLSDTDLSGTNLRSVDLVDADLSGADLSGADLSGADLSGADLSGVTWSKTTCPDGKISDQAGGTCLNHLGPPP